MIDLLFTNPAAFFQQLILLVPAFLIAVTLHELAHGVVANHLGDPTARLRGRLTLNPLPHIDVLGAIAIFIAGFGWAKPVPVNPANFRHPTRDMAVVAAAGPVSNFLVAFAALVSLQFVRRSIESPFFGRPLDGMLQAIYWINLGLGIFNLIPLPPLDGGHFLPYLLPRASWTLLRHLEQYGPFILILLVMSGATRYILVPARSVLSDLMFWLVRLIT